MRNTLDKRRELRWNFTIVLEDLDYADDKALFASRQSDMQEKTSRLHYVAKAIGLSINPSKTKTMHLNCKKSDPITVGGSEVHDVEAFTHLEVVLNKQGGNEADIKRRLVLARNAFGMLQPLWKSSKYSLRTKMRIFNTSVVPVLLYRGRDVENHSLRQEQTGCFPQEVHAKDTQSFLAKQNLERPGDCTAGLTHCHYL